ncbi:Afadin- and alpha-actinin-binding protein B [Dissostichus eleginoides]|uniref:Afadin- and alpha-actinin-binding protein B n=1 Tax=Dissostichus eleginoides TaxID=100907 RepID=A0AAD9BQF4_DISEL|nr:Afadin- and alpha-actinin-binding protein B [Dissostichus eleginoides]
MASRFGQKRVGRPSEYSDSFLLRDPSPQKELSPSDSWWADREEHGDSLREQLKEMSEHVARLQDTLRYERAKCARLQLRGNQQEGELKRREQHTNRLKERMSQLTERHREKGPSIEVLNIPPGGPLQKEATLHLMLERREAELREAMKLRHSLTTLLHGLRVDMEHSLSDVLDVQDDCQTENKSLDEAEGALGDHVTGGVVRSWRQVQSRLAEFSSEGHTGVGTDHEKLLARLDCELKESQQLVRIQQQLLQDSFASPVVSELADSYFLEEWERLQMRWAELDHQRRTFERERKSFTEAAIRLSHERCDFEQHKASLLKQKYLCEPPRSGKGAPTNSRTEGSALNFCSLGPTGISGCLPITPSPTKLGTAALYGVTVHTPSTPELYSALNLSYSRTSDVDHQSETWDGRADRMVHTLQIPPTDLSLESTFDDRW